MGTGIEMQLCTFDILFWQNKMDKYGNSATIELFCTVVAFDSLIIGKFSLSLVTPIYGS